MNDKEKNNNNMNDTPTENGGASEDSITLRSSSVKDRVVERNIKAAPVVHTSGSEDIRIPETPDDSVSDSVLPRFIKTNATPFVSVSQNAEPETDGKDIDKYSDRLNVKAPEKKPFTGYTAKLNIYTANHSSPADGGRMIRTPEEPAVEEDEDMKIADIGSEDFASLVDKPEDIPEGADAAPTRPIQDARGSLLREIAGTADDGVRRNPDQLMMEGFDNVGKKDDEEIAREQAADEELQTELKKTRQRRISSFKFWDKQQNTADGTTQDEKFSDRREKKALPGFLQKLEDKFAHLDTAFTPVPGDEYTDFNRRKETFNHLIAARKSVLLRLLAVGIIGIVLLIVDLAASASAASDVNGFFSLFNGNYKVFVTVNLILLLAVCVIMFRDIRSGLLSVLKVHPKADTALCFMLAAVTVQTVAAYFTQLKLEENFHLLAPAGVLLCVPYLLAKLFYYDNIRQCFKAAAAKSEKSYLRRLSDSELAAELLRDRENGGQNIVYAGKTRFIGNFLARSADSAYAGMPSSRSVLITAALSVLVGVVSGILRQDAVYGITAAAACAAFSFPVSCLTYTGFKLSGENKKLSVKSSFVQGYEDARDFSAVDNIIIDSSDLFTAKITNCLTAKGVSEKQAKFCAAVLTSGVGGPLNAALMEEVAALEDKFPAAENLVYEEKLGLSAWVSNCKVLLGTHALLVNHNVRVPEESAVQSFLGEGEKPVFLALEGKFAAVIGVKYSCIGDSADNLRELVKSGANILLTSYDSNITETYAEELLGMPECSVRIISSAAADKLDSSRQAITDSEEAGIVFTDSFESLCRCACAAVRLDRSKKTAKLVCEAGAYVSLILAAVLSFTGAFNGLNCALPVFVQLLWIGLCFVAPLLFSSSVADMKKSMPKLEISAPKKKSSGRTAGRADTEDTAFDEAEEPAAETLSGEEEASEGTAAKENAAENAAEASPEADGDASEKTEAPDKAEEPAQDEEDVPGVISQKTFDVLDALAEERPTGRRARKTAADTNDAEEEEPAKRKTGNAPSFSLSDILAAVKAFFARIFARLSVTEEVSSAEDEDDEDEAAGSAESGKTSEAPEKSKPAKKRPFTASIPVRRRGEAREEESDIIRQAQEEARMRASFTPPEMPDAPHYDLGKKDAEETPAKFVPPADTPNSYYNDSMFSRFEDDNIFAALHEEGTKPKIDF